VSNDTWKASVTGVAERTVNISFDEASEDVEVATYPSGMHVTEGDTVLVKVDQETGNSVLKVLDD